MSSPLTAITAAKSKRTNFLSVGVTLCALVAAICAAPLAFVTSWIAIWLLSLMTILVLGTFGIWAYHAINNPRLLDTENHLEQMAAISLLATSNNGDKSIVEAIVGVPVVENPRLGEGSEQ